MNIGISRTSKSWYLSDIQPWQHARRSRKEAVPISLQFLLPSAKRMAMQYNARGALNWNIEKAHRKLLLILAYTHG